MKTPSLAHIIELRLLNLFFLVVAIWFAHKKFKNTHQHLLNYFRGLATGVGTDAIGSSLFALFMFVYITVDSSMNHAINDKDPMGRFLNPLHGSLHHRAEGCVLGAAGEFCIE